MSTADEVDNGNKLQCQIAIGLLKVTLKDFKKQDKRSERKKEVVYY